MYRYNDHQKVKNVHQAHSQGDIGCMYKQLKNFIDIKVETYCILHIYVRQCQSNLVYLLWPVVDKKTRFRAIPSDNDLFRQPFDNIPVIKVFF